MLPESEIEPVESVPDADELPDGGDAARDALDRTVVLKLNGGLGTSMGMTRAKSLLEAKDGLSFLDVIARQVLEVRKRSGARLPLVLMNSFYTRDDTLAALERYPDLAGRRAARLRAGQGAEDRRRRPRAGLLAGRPRPRVGAARPRRPVHVARHLGHARASCSDKGYEYAFVSNADNLGATLDERILGWFAREELPFLMEVADRTEADRKGGHLAQRADGGGLVLREIAQTPDDDVDAFQDTSRHRFFNTNTLWVNLRALLGR